MQNATEGTIKETTYWCPRPGQDGVSRRRLSTRRSVTKSVVSATTRNNLPGNYICYGIKNFLFSTMNMSAFGGRVTYFYSGCPLISLSSNLGKVAFEGRFSASPQLQYVGR